MIGQIKLFVAAVTAAATGVLAFPPATASANCAIGVAHGTCTQVHTVGAVSDGGVQVRSSGAATVRSRTSAQRSRLLRNRR
jgi:hypothetical protein